MIELRLRKDFTDLDKYAEALGENLQKAVTSGLSAIGRYMRKTIREDLDKKSVGSTKAVRYNPKRKVWVSPAGTSPNSDTKELRKSISFELRTKNGKTESVFIGTDLDYGKYLEEGTSKMKARPYLLINAKRERRNMEDIMAEKIAEYVNKVGFK